MSGRRKGWDPEDIKAAVRKRRAPTGRRMTLTGLAKANGLRASACREALVYPVPAADKVISEFLGVSLHKLWPDRYDESGLKRPTIVGKRARKIERSQRLTAEAV